MIHAPLPLQSLFPWMSEDEDDAHLENPAPQFWVRTPPPPFRPTSPAHSPISHPRVRHCTTEPELPPQPRRRRDPAPHYCRCHAPLQAVAQVNAPKNCFSQKNICSSLPTSLSLLPIALSLPQTPSPPAVLPPPVFGAQRRERQVSSQMGVPIPVPPPV